MERFTPEEVQQDQDMAWKRAKVCFGGAWGRTRYKQIKRVLWRRGGVKPLRLIVIVPHPYKLSPHARTLYRQPAHLLTTDDSSLRAAPWEGRPAQPLKAL